MLKTLLVATGIFSCCLCVAGQFLHNRSLVIVDSFLVAEPEEQVTSSDIAAINVITNRDSLQRLGWEQVDTVTYIFTKAYRNRPDSIKRIPTRKQMDLKLGRLFLNDTLYSGRYIDYYSNGQAESEGTLWKGKLNGEQTVYFKNGNKRSVTNYKNGMREGICNDYYKNGALMQTRLYKEDRQEKAVTMYFINGQEKEAIRPRKATGYDTSISYYSNGNIKALALTKKGWFHSGKKQDKLDYYRTMFYQGLYKGDLKSANTYFYEIWLLDSTSIDTRFEEGLLLYNEFRFALAIAAFDKALQIEPFMMEALTYRALARIKENKYAHIKITDRNRDTPLYAEDMSRLPHDEQVQICHDLLLADTIDAGDYYVKNQVPEAILTYCNTNIIH